MSAPARSSRPSVVVRAKNKVETVRETLRGLREQTVEVEIVFVDSGSTDGTLQVAAPFCDKLVHMDPADFSYGRALNLGAAHAGGDIVFALSAHSCPPSRHWVEQALEAYDDPDVAATIGEAHAPDGSHLHAPMKLSLPCPELWGRPWWGFSNTASSWRRQVWERLPFDECVVACEDKEWMWRVLSAGYSLVVDPRLAVGGGHRRQASLAELYRRVYREHLVLAELMAYVPLGGRALALKWWSYFPYESGWPRGLRLFSPWRLAELLGEYYGDRAGAARRGAGTITRDDLDRTPALDLPTPPAFCAGPVPPDLAASDLAASELAASDLAASDLAASDLATAEMATAELDHPAPPAPQAAAWL